MQITFRVSECAPIIQRLFRHYPIILQSDGGIHIESLKIEALESKFENSQILEEKNDIRWWERMGESENDHWSLTVSLWRLNYEIELCGAIHPRRIFSLTTRGYSMENIKHISRSTSYCRLAMLLTLLMADLYAMDRLLSCQLAAYKCVTDPVADHRRNTHTAWLRSQIWVNYFFFDSNVAINRSDGAGKRVSRFYSQTHTWFYSQKIILFF